jgi:hypothetical protein
MNYFFYSSGALLFITALAKFVSSGGDDKILQMTDPVFGLPFRHVFWIAGTLELIIAILCFSLKRPVVQASLLAWLATGFLLYRISLIWSGYQKPCNCMGSLTNAIHISPQMANDVMKGILAYLLIGSYAALYSLWRLWKSSKQLASASLPEKK